MSDELAFSNIVSVSETSTEFEPFHLPGAIPVGMVEANDPLAMALRERVGKDLSAYQVFNTLDQPPGIAEPDAKEKDLCADATIVAVWHGLDVTPMADSIAPRYLWCKDGH